MLIGTHVDSRFMRVSVVIGGLGQPLYRRVGDGKYFVVGEPGTAYTLRVTNRHSGRIEVLTAIDGRNTQEDEAGDIVRNRGLVIPAHATADFRGWRIDDSSTREFVFDEPEHGASSYATGSTSNTGVIGFAAYQERAIPGPTGYRQTSEGLDGLGITRGMTTRGGNLGTSLGALQQDAVGRTSFTRQAGSPTTDMVVIGYDTMEALTRQGIIAPPEPDPFPGIGSRTGYAQFPTG